MRLRRGLLIAFGLVTLLASLDTVVRAAGSSSQQEADPANNTQPHHDAGMKAVAAGDYDKAIQHFQRVLREDAANPDALNMLAYCERKLGRLDDAFANYRRALQARERFPQAREYLGEAHLQAALRQLETLQGYGPEAAKERKMLADAVRRAAAALNEDGTFKVGAVAAGDW